MSIVSISISSVLSRPVGGLAGQADYGKHSTECRFEFNLAGTKLADCAYK